MFHQIINFFKQQNWEYTTIKDKTIVFLGINGENGRFQCIADINEDEKKLIFFSVCGTNVPDEKKLEMCELLTRLNSGKFLGNFEMDYEDGEIRYKTSMVLGSELIEPEILEYTIMTNILTMDISLSGLMKMINDNITPIEAFQLIENSVND